MTDAPDAKRTAGARRASMRTQGYRLIRRWVPDVRAEAFKRNAHRQSLAVANDPQERDDQAFIDSISDLSDR